MGLHAKKQTGQGISKEQANKRERSSIEKISKDKQPTSHNIVKRGERSCNLQVQRQPSTRPRSYPAFRVMEEIFDLAVLQIEREKCDLLDMSSQNGFGLYSA